MQHNPYSSPQRAFTQTSGSEDISPRTLQYLESGGKWAKFISIFNAFYVVLLSLTMLLHIQNKPDELVSDLIGIVMSLLIAIFSWQYAKHTKEIQTQPNTYKLQECFSASTAFLKVYGIMWIITFAFILLAVFVGLALFISR